MKYSESGFRREKDNLVKKILISWRRTINIEVCAQYIKVLNLSFSVCSLTVAREQSSLPTLFPAGCAHHCWTAGVVCSLSGRISANPRLQTFQGGSITNRVLFLMLLWLLLHCISHAIFVHLLCLFYLHLLEKIIYELVQNILSGKVSFNFPSGKV